jgi:hypothetical protein
VGTTDLLNPAPVFSEKTRVEKDEHFSQIQKFFLDSPVLLHWMILPFPKTKNPRTDCLDPGISLFYPLDLQHEACHLEGFSKMSRQVF